MSSQSQFGHSNFTNAIEIQQQLEREIQQSYIKTRTLNGKDTTYVEWFTIVQMANNIFGEDGWSNEITECVVDSITCENGIYEVTCTVQLRVYLKNGVVREDVGCGIGIDKEKGNSVISARKVAVSDALKRTLRLFGNNLGNHFDPIK
ncbi:DNA repair and recombination protein rad52, putative [Entamoeba invadens IP1]|uniref:DNA repair and recombination protein rad52, putative n=1 Tax=Entamoeba invadens IP1 TaxID=370355 RepID=A0A0A1TVT0_ENTIV|nr:DNA repair and recombination protein rad52, putative [Entamoeba invadens IP1]ELP84609.1 DNA repair and recombination protein rad52, putative [Entamoeba invadens IP1]|eukprot:XP_004183955.1 DNA repair and recombination protein rad52, putative [Entamoeba invadens IP1]